MINIAIVEDEKENAIRLQELLKQYGKATDKSCQTVYFHDGMDFLDQYEKKNFDIVFMDIDMPYLDGMSVSKRMRQKDEKIALIFVTRLSQYAVQGYEVDAVDFMVKPVQYAQLERVMKRAERRIEKNENRYIKVKTQDRGICILNIKEIQYLEVQRHRLTYHTDQGEYVCNGNLNAAKEELGDNFFAQCNSCYLVNMNYVKQIEGDSVGVGNDRLKISRGKYKDFMASLTRFYGEKH